MINTIRMFLDEQRKTQIERYQDNPDAMFKLTVHFPTVTQVAEKLAPDDPVLQAAADFHDYGRMPQLDLTGSFNDGVLWSPTDHHSIGYKQFKSDMSHILRVDEVEAEVLQQIANAILLHGLRGRAFPQEFARLDQRAKEVVDFVSLIDDVANGTQCAGYMLRECQEQAKNQSKGGFIPDANAQLRTVSPRVMHFFRKGVSFDRKECQTYPDYALFGASLAIRSLDDPHTRSIALEIMSREIAVWQYLDQDKLSQTVYPDGIVALQDIFDRVMDREYAIVAKDILQSHFSG